MQESTDGSYIETKDSALVWNYRDADPDFGSWQVGESWVEAGWKVGGRWVKGGVEQPRRRPRLWQLTGRWKLGGR